MPKTCAVTTCRAEKRRARTNRRRKSQQRRTAEHRKEVEANRPRPTAVARQDKAPDRQTDRNPHAEAWPYSVCVRTRDDVIHIPKTAQDQVNEARTLAVSSYSFVCAVHMIQMWVL